MKTRHLVDPELLPLLDSMPAMDFTAEILPAVRATPTPFVGYGDHSTSTTLTRRKIRGVRGAPELEIAIYAPVGASGPLPCIFHIHGGGYVAGDTQAQEHQHRAFASQLQSVVTSVEYRLAPETAFPGPIEDCYAALAWVAAHASELDINLKRLGVMGESAGGGLAAALAVMARDRGEYGLAFQQLIYPMLDDRTVSADEPHPYAGEFIWTSGSNRFGWTSLLGTSPGAANVSPYAAPARAENLAGLPPTYIACGALDLFIEENLDYGRRLMRAGVPVEMHVYAGAYHGFDILTDTAVARAARRDSLESLRKFIR